MLQELDSREYGAICSLQLAPGNSQPISSRESILKELDPAVMGVCVTCIFPTTK